MADRYFVNTMQIRPELDDPEVTRQILKAAAAALKEVKACALTHRDVSGGGLYVGLGGVGLTYLRMAAQLARGTRYAHGAYLQKHDVGRCLDLAAAVLGEADKLMPAKRVTFLEGTSGLLACRALLAHLQGNHADTQAHVQAVLGLWEGRIQGVLPDSECELLYGRAGYLYSLAWLQQQLGRDVVPHTLIKSVVAHILEEGLRGAAALRQQQQQQQLDTPAAAAAAAAAAGQHAPGQGGGSWALMWSWHNKRYLGAAHGVAGILYVLLHYVDVVRELDAEQQQQQQQWDMPPAAGGGVGSSSAAAGVDVGGSAGAGAVHGRYLSALVASLDALAAAQLPSGNLPTKLGDTQDERVAWCHGAAGLVLTMIKAAGAARAGGLLLLLPPPSPPGSPTHRNRGGGGGGGGDDGSGSNGAGGGGGGGGGGSGHDGSRRAERYLRAAVAAGDDIWQRGLLTKGVGLCHGISGNGYALLALARATGRPHHYMRAARGFALHGAQHWRQLYDVPDRPASLYEGLAGAINFWLAVVDDVQDSAWPGAEL